MKETARAAQAWADYLALGADRSLEKLLVRYQYASNVPSRRLKTLADWSRFFGWQQRLRDIADAELRATVERDAAYRRSILEEGLALPHERVRVLKELAERLYGHLAPEDMATMSAMRLQTLLGEFRGALDDVAKEKQERKEVKLFGGSPDAPMRIIVEYVDPDRPTAPAPPGPARDPAGS